MVKHELDIKEAFELKWLFAPKEVIDDDGRRERFKEVIRCLYMNGYCIARNRASKEEE